MNKRKLCALAFGAACLASSLSAQTVLFSQDWTNTGLITTDDNWSSLWNSGTGLGIAGFRGDDLTTAIGTDPQSILAADDAGILDVNANKTLTTFTTGGVTEFELANPTIALTGSGTADAPYLLIGVSTLGFSGINISYNLRDIETGADNAVSQIALQYRFGKTGAWTNVSAGYVADASTSPDASLISPISASLAAWSNSALLQFRIMASNAPGNDEWIGVDDIVVKGTSAAVPEPATYSIIGAAALALLALRRRSKR